MALDKLLILRYPEFSERARALFQQMGESPAFREYFFRDPAGAVGGILFPQHPQLTVAHINQANRLLFSLLSNDRLMAWSRGFQERIEAQIQSTSRDQSSAEAFKLVSLNLERAALYREIVEATRQFADLEWFYSRMVIDREQRELIASVEVSPQRLPIDVAVCIEVLIFAVAVAAVFLAVVPGVAPTPEDWVTRQDLQRITELITARLAARAQELRQTGALTSAEAAHKGTVL